MRSVLFFLSIAVQTLTAVASGGHHQQHKHVHINHRQALDTPESVVGPVPTATTSSTAQPSPTNADISDAVDKVDRALAVLAVINKERYSQPRYNNYEFADAQAVVGEKVTAPPLDYNADAADRISTRRSSWKRNSGHNSSQSLAYWIPPELAEAARVIAEASPPTPSTGDESELARQARAKYFAPSNDTNVPLQTYRRPDGLYKYANVSNDQILLGIAPAAGLTKRDTSSQYWLSDMQQQGSSPYAPTGYQVFRNVKDFGAKGDGVTDDTAAINKAISDGNRCGADCGSSTVYPAVVFFPPGTYLVSSPIIQYYNTQFLGDPGGYPTILAAASFIGLGVITSDVYVGDQEEWYINTNNFLRNVRNFKMDITRTDPDAYVCAIHWQVARGTTLENIEFYMSQAEGNTQQGIYMENGSGGFMSNLTFVGGNFGAYLGNQQFTTSQLVFVQCKTAMQVRLDWAWTMQDIIIESCGTGVIVIGGAGGPLSTGQGVGSLTLVDAIIANTPTGIITSLYQDNSTTFLLQNVGFFNVQQAIVAETITAPILAGGDEVLVDSWGLGMYANSSGTFFAQQSNLATMNRNAELVGSKAYVKPNFFTRRRPQYYDLQGSQVFDVRSYGAKGDGNTDDTVVLNSILDVAANLSAIVYFPYGIYVIHDTLNIPKNSRIIGQAWPQIMAKGSKFQDINAPHVAVRVGSPGDVGIAEIQNLLFTVSGPTAGTILMEWNIHESVQGSVGLWDSHFRVGGAKGSQLQSSECPKQASAINHNCIAASLVLHITPSASAYMENVWVWTADHDLDIASQDQIDVYSGRGILIESQGPTWLYGTASEHNVLYQYQVSNAKNLVMGMMQTESPYFQPAPKAPVPFPVGLFPNDPTFSECSSSSLNCAVSWAVRVIESSTIYMLGSGMYSWFSAYSQYCLTTDDCQDRGFYIEESNDVWIFNLVTKAIRESISPQGETPLYAKDTKNGYTSSLLGWFREPTEVIGERNFTGYYLYSSPNSDDLLNKVSSTCKTAMTRLIECADETYSFLQPAWPQAYANDTLADICDSRCELSIKTWYDDVTTYCSQFDTKEDVMNYRGGILWAGWNQTCLKDPDSGSYCGDVMQKFTAVDFGRDMPESEMCSYCYMTTLQLAQASPYSFYDEYYQGVLETVHSRCGVVGSTDIPPAVEDHTEEPTEFCASKTYTTVEGDTCDSIALAKSVSSVALFIGSDTIRKCTNIIAGLSICLPFECESVYSFSSSETCTSIEQVLGMEPGKLRQLNPWINGGCTNLQDWSVTYGHVLCVSPQGGTYTETVPPRGVTSIPSSSNGYAFSITLPPENAAVANGTTTSCGRWHVPVDGDTCASICVQENINFLLFLAVNPSLSANNCTAELLAETAYCCGPVQGWGLTPPSPPMTTIPDLISSSTISSTGV